MYEVSDILCEALTVDKVFDIDVHPIAPIIRYDSRYVDALLVGIGLAFMGNDLMIVSIACCATVFVAELLLL